MRTIVSISLASVLALAGTVDAHIHLTSPMARTDSQLGDQKEQHCGVANQVRNPARVTVFQPGATITVTWMETIQHPGWFRIAFQPDGAVFGIPPVGAGGAGAFPTVNQEGLDAANNSIVLADRIADGLLSATVTLPNVECANCTLQFIQVMTDKAPYTIDALSDDIYFNCADITLSNTPGAPDAGPGAGPDAGAGGDAGTGGGGTVDGGCSTSGGGGLAGTALLAGLFALRRRRGR